MSDLTTIEGSSGEGFWATDLPAPSGRSAEIVLFEQTMGSVVARLSFTAHSRLHASLFLIEPSGLTLRSEATSCHIFLTHSLPAVLNMSWNRLSHIDIYINSTLVGSTDTTAPIPRQYVVPEPPKIEMQTTDYSRDNLLAVRRRRARLIGHQPIPRRIRESNEYMMDALKTEMLQIQDLLTLSRGGAFHHASGLAARLRLLIADGNPLPLLQHCAATLDAPLIMYCCRSPERGPPIKNPNLWVEPNFSASPERGRSNPVDIDVWLKFPAMIAFQKTYSHRDLLWIIGNTVGAHVDRDVDRLVLALRDMKSQINISGELHGYLRIYITNVSVAVLSLIEMVLSGRDDPDI